MDRNETLKVLSVLKAAYPQFYKGMTREDAEAVVGLWGSMFADDPYMLVAGAVKAFIASDTRGFPPAVGQVREKLASLSAPDEMTDAEAWGLVSRAISNSLYESRKEFEALPETVRRVVGSHNQLREWAAMDISEVQTVVASNFQRSYRARSQRDREYRMLPGDVRRTLEMAAGRIKSLPTNDDRNDDERRADALRMLEG